MKIADKLKVEQAELEGMIARLGEFIDNGATTHDKYNEVLNRQSTHMVGHLECLKARIEILESGDKVELANA